LGAVSAGVLLCIICKVLRPERHAGILEGESDVEETNGRADIEDEEDSPWALADPPSAGPEEVVRHMLGRFPIHMRCTDQI
ncbi:unnamed protein product, partial [Cladocopium goreaui]